MLLTLEVLALAWLALCALALALSLVLLRPAQHADRVMAAEGAAEWLRVAARRALEEPAIRLPPDVLRHLD